MRSSKGRHVVIPLSLLTFIALINFAIAQILQRWFYIYFLIPGEKAECKLGCTPVQSWPGSSGRVPVESCICQLFICLTGALLTCMIAV